MRGNVHGDKPVKLTTTGPGLRQHEITTGVVNVYEGITIATIDSSAAMTPIIIGSAENLVCAAYDRDGKRALLDGGFTRLFYKWESAGTERYVVNAAGWLVNMDD